MSRRSPAIGSECNRVPSKPAYRELLGKGSEAEQAAEAAAYARSWNDSIVDDIFGGLLQSTIQCRACRRTSHTFEPFLGLAVPLPPPPPDGRELSVGDCLRAFCEQEELEGDNSYKCESCKRQQPHSKRLQVFRPPRVLVVTLKRFAQRASSPGFFSRLRAAAKNSSPVLLEPDRLDLTPYCNPLGLRGLAIAPAPSPSSSATTATATSTSSGPVAAAGGRGGGAQPPQPLHQPPQPLRPLYQLVAVSNHSGSLEGGHYTAQALGADGASWYNFNDATVRREPGRPSGSSSAAYVLFYRLATL
ncbi:Ubiquitin carboxyl-terminal hydrolase 8 [Tetrabaena socialis]|uniref:ubiquitinyl hydrolase 1 n=1 Tax=Tetrabaena socialis TaxID=47790 RepID=A0A2J8ABF6_9CHLO|nr:Ubiquitin carboxyl-terminal hydrolase 8 [Tetrabaena socialis]|eukprot:PNH09862.1 Ubiquitin carboxyl-terminal hydrolase 8 [Tetrabaena socialis]